MRFRIHNLLLILLCAVLQPTSAQTDILHYKSNVVDTIFGQAVADPYRWMEDLGSDSVKQWMDAQRDVTRDAKMNFGARLTIARNDISCYSARRDIGKLGNWYFRILGSSVYSGGRVPVLYYREHTDDRFKIAFDPNEAKSNKRYRIEDVFLSDSLRYLAITLSEAFSDWREIRVHDMLTGKDLADKLKWVKFSNVVWWKDGFFYCRYRKPKQNIGQTESLSGQELYYHLIGTDQDDDKLVIAVPPYVSSTIKFRETSNHRYLVVNMQQKMNGELYAVLAYKDLNEGIFGDLKLIAKSPVKNGVSYSLIDYIDSAFFILTNYQAPHNRVLRSDKDSVNRFVEIIPQYDKVLRSVSHTHHELVATYFTAGSYEMHMFNYKGQMQHSLSFTEGVSVSGFWGGPEDTSLIFYQNTFYLPPAAYRYSFNSRNVSVYDQATISYDPKGYITQIVKYISKDGTEIPMYLTYKKGVSIKGDNPVILYAFGESGISAEPFYECHNITFFDNKGILAVPMIRGGGEFGDAWREAGVGRHRQTAIDDFTSAAEFLVKAGFTTKEHLAFRSNGGSLVAAAMVQHPEICQVLVDRVGVYDLLRFHKFTGGKYWIDDYGSPDDSLDFNNLRSYSPLHNIHPNTPYPAALLITADNDDRVPPFHTYKFLAALQQNSSNKKPHILCFEEATGHNGTDDYLDNNYEESFVLAFIYTQMGLSLNPF